MSAPRGWCQCGAPLWRDEGCQVCWLVGLTPRHVRSLAEGYSFRPAITLAEANSTESTDATSRMLPVGCEHPVDLSGLTGHSGYMVWLKWVWDASG